MPPASSEPRAWLPDCCGHMRLSPGIAFGVMLLTVASFPICYYGALRDGAAIAPMNMLLKEREVAYYMANSEGRGVQVSPRGVAPRCASEKTQRNGLRREIKPPAGVEASRSWCRPRSGAPRP
jgi:acyl-CoA synthetase (AMP-forming)/AMP-acid ligase II